MAILRHTKRYDERGAAYLVSYPAAQYFARTIADVAKMLAMPQSMVRPMCKDARCGAEVFPFSHPAYINKKEG